MNYFIIGGRIKALRKAQNLTQQKLSESLKINEKYLSNIETGRDKCSLSLLVSIANTLNCSVDYLLSENLKCNKTGEDKYYNRIINDTKILSEEQRKFVSDFIEYLIRHSKDS